MKIVTDMKIAMVFSALAVVMSGCVNNVRIQEPTSVRPQSQPVPVAVTGSIFQAGSYRPLFEDRRARFPGDTLLITISEKTSASNTTSNNASRTASANVAVPGVRSLPGSLFNPSGNLVADAQSKFEDKDQAKNDNLFSGTITATVIEVLPNGNLVVSGEKQVGVNGEVDTMRFSGIVNPLTIQPGNTVLSAQVADARIETVSRSNVDVARVAGFLGRFFMSFIPFR
jgi:flagellar L-ring protein precursor FlgH